MYLRFRDPVDAGRMRPTPPGRCLWPYVLVIVYEGNCDARILIATYAGCRICVACDRGDASGYMTCVGALRSGLHLLWRFLCHCNSCGVVVLRFRVWALAVPS